MSPLRARVIVVGTELLDGGKADANGPEIARRLNARGVLPSALSVLPDDRVILAEALRAAIESGDALVVVAGGLGPTEDDLTREALTDATGIGCEEDAEASRRIADLLARRGRTPGPSSLRQALRPAGATAVQNVTGMAVGAVLPLPGCVVVLLPGPPGELAAMIEEAFDVALRALASRGLKAPASPARAEIVLAGIGEGDAATAVSALDAMKDVQAAWLARPGEVRLLLRHADAARIAGAVAGVRGLLGRDVVSVDGRGVTEVVLATLAEREETIATAESCTGGLVAAALTSVPGSSACFRRGFVTYSDEAKVEMLGVAPDVLAEHGAVSREVALAMAHGARRFGRADWGVGVTGIAGPGGATETKPVGLVHWAVALPDGRLDAWTAVFIGSRDDVRRRATAAALDAVRRCL